MQDEAIAALCRDAERLDAEAEALRKKRQEPIILSDGRYRVAIPAKANLSKVARWMRVCGFSLKWKNGWLLQEVRHG